MAWLSRFKALKIFLASGHANSCYIKKKIKKKKKVEIGAWSWF
jgi:hypothetical protein